LGYKLGIKKIEILINIINRYWYFCIFFNIFSDYLIITNKKNINKNIFSGNINIWLLINRILTIKNKEIKNINKINNFYFSIIKNKLIIFLLINKKLRFFSLIIILI
jgi:hypothetical protein